MTLRSVVCSKSGSGHGNAVEVDGAVHDCTMLGAGKQHTDVVVTVFIRISTQSPARRQYASYSCGGLDTRPSDVL